MCAKKFLLQLLACLKFIGWCRCCLGNRPSFFCGCLDLHTQMCVQVSVPLHSFPITYKYTITRKSGDIEREVSSVFRIAALAPCLEHHCLSPQALKYRHQSQKGHQGLLSRFQVGENRIVSLDSKAGDEEGSAAPAAIVIQEDGTFRHEHLWRGAAVALPVFALRSRESVGAGEFQDLKMLVTLCHQAGMAALDALLGMPDRTACRSERRHVALQQCCRNLSLTSL